MLQVKQIKKTYTTGGFTQTALDNISLNFRKNEFVAILGESGSGKTTFLNVVGGLDQYDSGDLIINGQSTKDFTEKEWDAYRNNSVGFVFQSYNLIGHLNIADNVELGLTLSGIPKGAKGNK
ncbi:MAG: ATP-binding cassette domain-containing protein, partial [Eubacteriales bacterium]|nr:ATP-binding cassette domain-containing protein [Eubacteriales bacterium]